MIIPTTRWLILGVGLAIALVAGPALGHADDPKTQAEPRYEGVGIRGAGGGGSVGLGGPGGSQPGGGGNDFVSVGSSLRSWVTVAELGDSLAANDCWGYVAPSGREYAIICTTDATAFVEVTDPDEPQIVEVIAGPFSGWRDVKVYDRFAYVVTENQMSGIQVIDLSGIDQGLVFEATTLADNTTGASHNVAIDEASGFLYRCGGGTNGLRIYDLAQPAQPRLVALWNTRYVHDAQIVTYEDGPYAGRQIAFCCSGFNEGWVETGLDILDVTDKRDIRQLGRVVYDNGFFSHQAWLSEDRDFIFLNDEGDEVNGGVRTTVIVIDVRDLANPREVSSFTNGSMAVGHNLYVRGDQLFSANYASGLRVFDVRDPLNVTETAWFDTRPEDDDPNFQGLWSVYPFFPSGTVIASDRQRGLFVLRVDPLPASADLDGSGVVGFDDLALLIGSWGPCAPCPAETDIVNLVKSGVPLDEIMNSLADAIVQQNLSVLTRGNTLKRAKVLLLGGPNTYLPFLQQCWRQRIPEDLGRARLRLSDTRRAHRRADLRARERRPVRGVRRGALRRARAGRDRPVYTGLDNAARVHQPRPQGQARRERRTAGLVETT